MNEERIKLLEPPYSEEMLKDFDSIMGKGNAPLNIFRVVGNNQRVLHRMIIGGLLDKGSISIQDRELMILRICGLCKAEYEWGVHVAIYSKKTGFNQLQIDNTIMDQVDKSLWNENQFLILELANQLHETQNCSDELWEKLSMNYQSDQLIELIMLAGLYHAVSFIVNCTRIKKETFAPEFPKFHETNFF